MFNRIETTNIEGRRARQREVWIWVEPFRGKPPRSLGALIQTGQALADDLDAGLAAILMDNDLEEPLRTLGELSVGRILKGEDPVFGFYDGAVYAEVLGSLLGTSSPLALLACASVLGREVTARLAARRPCYFVPRCTGFYSMGGDGVRVSRAVLGGQMEKWAEYSLDRPLVASMQLEILRGAKVGVLARAPIIEDLAVVPPAPQCGSGEIQVAERDRLSVEEAEVVVAGGGGAGDREGFRLVERLAGALGGVVAGTQVAVDRGWIPHFRQIGRSGVSVYPDLFIACGISGSVHFTSGMVNSGTIVAINSDPEAPIFRIADISIVGDLRRVIPSLLRELEKKEVT